MCNEYTGESKQLEKQAGQNKGLVRLSHGGTLWNRTEAKLQKEYADFIDKGKAVVSRKPYVKGRIPIMK